MSGTQLVYLSVSPRALVAAKEPIENTSCASFKPDEPFHHTPALLYQS